jgi:hypothetical protein
MSFVGLTGGIVVIVPPIAWMASSWSYLRVAATIDMKNTPQDGIFNNEVKCAGYTHLTLYILVGLSTRPGWVMKWKVSNGTDIG